MQTTQNTINPTTTPTKIFLTGATGYIGGSVLTQLLHPSQTGKWDITALTRSEHTLPKFQQLGIKTILASLDDSDILTQAASEADIILNLADSDHLSAAKAISKGANTPTTNGKHRILIHCSGTGALADDARGNYSTDKIYSDLDMESIYALPVTNLHRDVDTYLVDNNKSENCDLIIVAPPTIHGIGSGPFNRLSIQVPSLIKIFSKTGRAATIGKGVNIWSHVHIDDLADFFVLLVEKSLEGKASINKDGWYFVENGEYVAKDVASKVGSELEQRGVIEKRGIGEFSAEEVEKHMGSFGWTAIASNSRCRAERARSLGWKPVSGRDGIYESMSKEVELILAQGK